jgi:MtrB/PioB family decaheme-associated outer membrane protein
MESTMKITNSLKLLAALGVLSAAATHAVAQVDTSKWKCEACPYPKAGISGEVEVGAGGVKGDRAAYGDFNGLNGKRTFVVAGGSLRARSDDGYGAEVEAADLGLDTRSLSARAGQQGLWGLSLGYSEIPHKLEAAGASPFIGVGGDRLTLPAGYPAASTASMPLAGTLQPVDLGSQRKRLDLGASWDMARAWSTSVKLRHDVRDGTQRLGASFFNTTSQLAAPVDQTTDQLEAAVSYTTQRLFATLAYQASAFRNGPDAVTWNNPFFPVLAGADRGQMALAPDNQFHQVMASGGFELTPKVRVSGDIAAGRMTQDAAFVAATLNPNLAASLPATSLQGKVDTFTAHLNLNATPVPGLRLNAGVWRDQRDNRTPVYAMPALATDLFLYPGTRRNAPFSVKQSHFKASGDWRATQAFRVAAGYERDERVRSYQAAVRTAEDTVWGRASLQALENWQVSLRVAHAERTHSPYGSVTYGIAPQNSLLRLPNLAQRNRNTTGLRTDIGVTEKITLALFADLSDDRYPDATIGLQRARSTTSGMELAIAVAEQSQVYFFFQDDQGRSRQAGSEAFAAPDWTGRLIDSTQVAGFGAKHQLLGGKLELGADAVFTRSRSRASVETVVGGPAYPVARDARDSSKLYASYRLDEKMSISARWWYEEQHMADWHLDGIAPGSVGSLLALGELAPSYRVHVLSLALRYRY